MQFKSLKYFFETHKRTILFLVVAFIILDIFLWVDIIRAKDDTNELQLYFLDVGQGDAALAILPGGAKMVIDGGPPNGKLIQELEKVLPLHDRYIDLVMMSHPQLDHFGGLVELMKRYQVGAFLSNGRGSASEAFQELAYELRAHDVPEVVLGKDDRVHYRESVADILSPNNAFLHDKEVNNSSLVMRLRSASSTTLFTGDMEEKVEIYLTRNKIGEVDILKVPHHGSKFSSTASFLHAVEPLVSVIEVGKNSYGHPTPQTLGRLGDIGTRIFRTDKDGTVGFSINGKTIKIIE